MDKKLETFEKQSATELKVVKTIPATVIEEVYVIDDIEKNLVQAQLNLATATESINQRVAELQKPLVELQAEVDKWQALKDGADGVGVKLSLNK